MRGREVCSQENLTEMVKYSMTWCEAPPVATFDASITKRRVEEWLMKDKIESFLIAFLI